MLLLWSLMAPNLDTYVDSKFRRVSAESAYLTPDVLARPNLTVVIHATGLKVLFDLTNGGYFHLELVTDYDVR